jgi:hypothetical protein
MFWFKSKEITVDCFTVSNLIHDGYRPKPAMEFVPEGWKTLPKTVGVRNISENSFAVPNATMKQCKGFINLFSSGFILPLFSDMVFDTTQEPMVKYAPSSLNYWHHHPSFQMWDGLYAGYKHVKILSPWSFVEKSGIKFAWNRCDWHDTENAGNYHVVSAVIDFKYQHSAQINLFVKDNSHISLTAGQPMVHIIPLSEHKVKLKYHVISEKEHDSKFGSFVTKFVGNYNESKRIKQEVESRESKCPFGFGK